MPEYRTALWNIFNRLAQEVDRVDGVILDINWHLLQRKTSNIAQVAFVKFARYLFMTCQHSRKFHVAIAFVRRIVDFVRNDDYSSDWLHQALRRLLRNEFDFWELAEQIIFEPEPAPPPSPPVAQLNRYHDSRPTIQVATSAVKAAGTATETLQQVIRRQQNLIDQMLNQPSTSFVMSDFDSATCRVCYSVYDDETHKPMVLPCAHTVCEDCRQRMEKYRARAGDFVMVVTCAVCLKTSFSSQAKVNFSLLDLVQELKSKLTPRARSLNR